MSGLLGSGAIDLKRVMCDRLLLDCLADRSLPDVAMSSGLAKVCQIIDRRQNLTVVELTSWYNANATENVNSYGN
ncbi:hypothetical protein QUA56_09725 [Microcoleus sp. N3A4]|uniref:hypothetical protein n=1 Tax=Microcoleus sp. N3A4 TaxID=3055379 RepID=UPI002FD317F0